MQQQIAGYHLDENEDWVAELTCGHFQHVRHNPPWMNRPWVVTAKGRDSMLGAVLICKKCEQKAPPDKRATSV